MSIKTEQYSALAWQKPSQYSQVSEDGRYSVCKIGPAWFYEAWRTRAHKDGPHLVSTNLKTADEARAACEADARE